MEKNTKIILIILIGGIFIFAFLVMIFSRKTINPPIPSSAPIATSPEPSTETEINYKKPKEAEEFLRKNPLVKYLPYYNNHFEIKYTVDDKINPIYKIKLNAILNKPSQFEQYKEDYLKYKIEAIEWIKSKGIDYTKLNIEWEPEDPKNINFSSEVSPVNQNNTCQTCR